MSTGIETWQGVAQLGAVYPMVGTEGFLVLIGVVYWIAWHIVNTRREQEKLRANGRKYRK